MNNVKNLEERYSSGPDVNLVTAAEGPSGLTPCVDVLLETTQSCLM